MRNLPITWKDSPLANFNPAHKTAFADPHAVPFQPLGKPKMREWVQINLPDSEEYRRYLPVFDESIDFIAAQQEESMA